MYRHFQSWTDRQVRVTYKNLKGISVRVVYANSAQAARLEKMLILKHKPIDNTQKLTKYLTDAKDVNIYDAYIDTEPEAPF